jgi:hypothetical protein
MARPNTADFDSTRLRLPPELHQQLKDAADAAGRSMNEEILLRLRCSFDPQIAGWMEDYVAKLKEEQRQLKEERRRQFLEQNSNNPEWIDQIDALIDKAMGSKGKPTIIIQTVKRNPTSGNLEIESGNLEIPGRPDEPDESERPRRDVVLRKLTKEEREARARALDKAKAANQHRKAE